MEALHPHRYKLKGKIYLCFCTDEKCFCIDALYLRRSKLQFFSVRVSVQKQNASVWMHCICAEAKWKIFQYACLYRSKMLLYGCTVSVRKQIKKFFNTCICTEAFCFCTDTRVSVNPVHLYDIYKANLV